MKDDALSLPLLASFFIHGVAIVLASIILTHTAGLRRQDFMPIGLVDLPRKEQPKPIQKVETPPEIKKPPPPPPKFEKAKEPKPVAKSEIVQAQASTTAASYSQRGASQARRNETHRNHQIRAHSHRLPAARVEGGGSEAGAGNLFGKGDVAVVPGAGTAGGGGGTATSGLGRGSGDPGLPAVRRR